jgi:dolichyl-diphosphooligosaccharide--protein glycosyltransferase
MAALTCIVIYYFGKDLGGPKVGLLAALFLALSPAYIGRTSLGFFDTENVGIFGILLVSLFYLRSLDEERGRITSLAYSILAGLFLGYVFASWGASRYVMSLLALFTFVLVIAKRYSQRLLISYAALTFTSFLIAIGVPKLGFRFITEFESIAVIGVLLILLMKEVTSHLTTQNLRFIFITLFLLAIGSFTLFLLAIGSSAVVLSHFNIIHLPMTKFRSVLNPFQRSVNPLVESVQEHRPATWSAFYYQFGLLVFLAPLGIFFAFQKISAKSLFIITFMLTDNVYVNCSLFLRFHDSTYNYSCSRLVRFRVISTRRGLETLR